jgi:membrane protein YdbS with pleckstrin-like domain
MAPAKELPDPAEPDLYWAGHSGWAMMPGVVVGVIASAVVMLGLHRLGDWLNLPDRWTAVLRFWLVLSGWITAGVVWAYRGASFVYRLTPTRLYVDFGMLSRPVPPIPLEKVTGVECRAWALRRWFGVGAVIVRADGRPPVRLRGLFRPERLAQAIEEAAREAKAA